MTGSGWGLGEAIARKFASQGATLVINSFRAEDGGQAVADALPDATYVPGDAADLTDGNRLVEQAVARYGRLDILVNNADSTERCHMGRGNVVGPVVIGHSDLETADPDVWKWIYDINVVGPWQVTAAALPHLRASGSGQVINLASLSGESTMSSSVPYAASKAAVSHMTRLLANALGPEVRVNAVAPGLVDLAWNENWMVVRDRMDLATPMGRSATPAEIADMVMGIASSTYMTGNIVMADGGWHLR